MALKGLVYTTGAEVQYALQTNNWTVEGAQQAAIYGTIGAAFDIGANGFVDTTLRINNSIVVF